MNKILYTSLIVLVTAWSVFFIANYYQDQTLVGGQTNQEDVVQEVVEREVVLEEDQRIEAIEKVSSAIVGVVNFYGERTIGEGSGIVYKIDKDHAYIVTNEHVISQGDYFEVVLSDGERMEAELIGSDLYTDLAVLKVSSEKVTTAAEFGDTETMKVGQTVLAIGNPLGLNFAGSVAQGIISGHDRTVGVDLDGNGSDDWEMTVLQTDTAINPGNSGGALVDLNGKVIGINSLKIAESSVEGMSFAIPTYIALPIIEDLEEHGKVLRPQLGISIQDMTSIPDRLKELLGINVEQRDGVFITELVKESVAQKQGLEAGDVILAIDGEDTLDTMTFRKKLYTYRTGDVMVISVLREDQKLDIEIKL